MSAPIVAVIGSTGYVGTFVVPVLLEALNQTKLKEVRVLVSVAKLTNEKVVKYQQSGAKVVPINYESVPSITEGLKGANIAMSFLGTGTGMDATWKNLLDALVAAKVQVYFPSEYEDDLINGPASKWKFRMWEMKREHFLEAKRRGLNPIRIAVGPIMEDIFQPDLGLDCVSRKWTVVKGAADKICALTSERDVSRFALQAVLLAHKDLGKVPDILEVYSEVRTLREYARALEKVSGKKIEISEVEYDDMKKEFEATDNFWKLVMLIMADSAYDFRKSGANQLLNPNESLWKLKRFEEYAIECKGVPRPTPNVI